MKRTALLGVALLAVTGACLPVSLSPLYTEDQLVELPEIVGTWRSSGNDSEQMVITPVEDRGYRVVFTEDDDEPMAFLVHFVRLDDTLYWDMTVSPDDLEDDMHGFHLLPVHSFAKVLLEGETLRLAQPDLDWMKKQVEEGRTPAHVVLPDDRFVLTAETAELQAFFREQAGGAEAWSSPDVFHRQGE
jgi:hypothetical protein